MSLSGSPRTVRGSLVHFLHWVVTTYCAKRLHLADKNLIADKILLLVTFLWYGFYKESVTNISNLSPTHLVSNIRHHHRCNHFNALREWKLSILRTRNSVFVAVLLSFVLVVKAKSAFLSAMMNNMDTAKETVNNFNKVNHYKHGPTNWI